MKEMLILSVVLVSGTLYSQKNSPKKIAAKRPSTHDIVERFSAQILKESSEWESGYYAVFNALKMRVAIEDRDVASIGQEDYEAWVDELCENEPEFDEKRSAEKIKHRYLGIKDIERIILINVGMGQMPEDIFLCDYKNDLTLLSQDASVRDAIKRFQTSFKSTDKPFYVIVGNSRDKHWVTFVLLKDRLMVLDSFLSNIDSIAQKIKTLFFGDQKQKKPRRGSLLVGVQ